MADARLVFKVVTIGRSFSGKTTFVERVIYDHFKPADSITFGANFFAKRLQLDGKEVILQILDMAGKMQFKSLREIYYVATSCTVLFLDLTDERSFLELPFWVEEAIVANAARRPPMVIIGSKADDKHNRQHILHHSIATYLKELAKWYGQPISYFETSALSGLNVDQIAVQLADTVIARESGSFLDYDSFEQLTTSYEQQLLQLLQPHISRQKHYADIRCITLHPETGQLLALYLPSIGLTSTIDYPLPANLLDSFPEVRIINMEYNNLAYLPVTLFANNQLVSLNLSNNPLGTYLERVGDVFFSTLGHLQHLELRNCGLQDFPLRWLHYMPHLRSIDLRGNPLAFPLESAINSFPGIKAIGCWGQFFINRFYSRYSVFFDYKHLKRLEEHYRSHRLRVFREVLQPLMGLNHEQVLRVIHHAALSNNIIMELNLSSLHLGSVDARVFDALLDARYINLSHNQLQHVDQLFRKVRAWLTLDLSYNQLHQMPLVGKLNLLTSLNLAGNTIQELDPLPRLTRLTSLDISHTSIRHIPRGLHNYPLETLYLSGLGLDELPAVIPELTALRILDLSHNRLAEFPLQLSKLPNLHHLYLNGNRLEEVPWHVISQLPKLELLDISGNRLPNDFEDRLQAYLRLRQLEHLADKIIV